jgi:protein subunit release factor A
MSDPIIRIREHTVTDDTASKPLNIPEDDNALLAQCRVETFRSGGPGGQHQNVTESGVRLVHLPTGVRATARDERSQHRNRSLALRRLREKLEELTREDKPRVATRVTRTQKKKRLEEKKRRGREKELRRRPDTEGE